MNHHRRRLPTDRKGLTHKGVIHAEPEVCPHCQGIVRDGLRKFFLTVNFFEDGKPGEVFISFDESGSTLDGFADAWATSLSLNLQTGVSLEKLSEKFAHQQWNPAGLTDDPAIGVAKSPVDCIIRLVEMLTKLKQEEIKEGTK